VRKVIVRVVQILLAALVIWFAVGELSPHWQDLRASWDALAFHWPSLLASGLLVLTSYGVLIETWRRTIRRWGHHLALDAATRIWFVSNLGKYVPGKIWQITAMGAMAREAGVPASAAVGSSLLIAVVNVLAGGVVILLTAFDAGLVPPRAALVGAVLLGGVALLPPVLPGLAERVSRWRGRDVAWPAIRVADLALMFAGCALAWCLYGVAFEFLARGTLPETSGATRYYIASFTVSARTHLGRRCLPAGADLAVVAHALRTRPGARAARAASVCAFSFVLS
jgi:hypothetical protein